jgi:hypothetical protein
MDTTSSLRMLSVPDAHALLILSLGTSSVSEGDDVATKKQPAKRAKKIVPSQPIAITIRGSSDWKGWLEEFAARMRTKPTAVIDLALAKLAHQEGFREPPPRI